MGEQCAWCETDHPDDTDCPDEDALNLAECDYYQGLGTCSFGCYDEPACMTNRPRGGWPPLNLPPMEEANRRGRRLSHRVETWLAWLPFGRYGAGLDGRTPSKADVLAYLNATPTPLETPDV